MDYSKWGSLALEEENDDSLAILRNAKHQADASFQNHNSNEDLPNFYDELSRQFFLIVSRSSVDFPKSDKEESFGLGLACAFNSMACRMQLRQFKNVTEISNKVITLLIESAMEDILVPLFRAKFYRCVSQLHLHQTNAAEQVTRTVLELHALYRQGDSATCIEFNKMFQTLQEEMGRLKVPISLQVIKESGVLTNDELLRLAFTLFLRGNNSDAKLLCQNLEHVIEWDNSSLFVLHYLQGQLCLWLDQEAQALLELSRAANALMLIESMQPTFHTIFLWYDVAKLSLKLLDVRLCESALNQCQRLLSRLQDSTASRDPAAELKPRLISAMDNQKSDAPADFKYFLDFESLQHYVDSALKQVVERHVWCSGPSARIRLRMQLDSMGLILQLQKCLLEHESLIGTGELKPQASDQSDTSSEDDDEGDARPASSLDEILTPVRGWSQTVPMPSAYESACSELWSVEEQILCLLDRIGQLAIEEQRWDDAKSIEFCLIDAICALKPTMHKEDSMHPGAENVDRPHNKHWAVLLSMRAHARAALGHMTLSQTRDEHDQFSDEVVVDEVSQVWEEAGADFQACDDKVKAFEILDKAARLLQDFVQLEPFVNCLSYNKYSDVQRYLGERAHDLHRGAAKMAFQLAESLELEVAPPTELSINGAVDSDMRLDRVFEWYQKASESMFLAGLCMQIADDDKATITWETCKFAQGKYRQLMTAHVASLVSVSHQGFHAECGDVAYHLACAYFRLGKFEYAHDEAYQVKAHYAREGSSDERRRLKALEILALSSHALGRFDEAEQALADMTRSLKGPYRAAETVEEIEELISRTREMMKSRQRDTKLTSETKVVPARKDTIVQDKASIGREKNFPGIKRKFQRFISSIDFNLVIAYFILGSASAACFALIWNIYA